MYFVYISYDVNIIINISHIQDVKKRKGSILKGLIYYYRIRGIYYYRIIYSEILKIRISDDFYPIR